jgi:hypothetical protein
MSKHDVITDNLIALTRARSFDTAVSGWTVKRLVALRDRKMQSCELCGTRFKRGAVIVHQRSGGTILVGGTCLQTIQRRRFPHLSCAGVSMVLWKALSCESLQVPFLPRPPRRLKSAGSGPGPVKCWRWRDARTRAAEEILR